MFLHDWLVTMAYVLFFGFQAGFAGVLTIRVATYGFGGRLWPIFYPVYWLLFFTTGWFLLMMALPLRLVGIRLFPVFTPR
jgi:hypothetical protein